MGIRLLIADDHGLIRAGVRAVCDSEPDLTIVAEAEDGAEALRKACETQPDVAVLDIQMPGVSGVQAAREIRQACPKTRVLILTMHDDTSFVRSAMAAGCSGFVAKKAIGDELVTAIRQVYAGRSYLNVSLVDSDLHDFIEPRRTAARDGAAALQLSAREKEVLELLAYGHTNQEIAKQLHLSDKTVGTYRARIVEKLGLKSRADIVRYALDTGLLGRERLASGEGDTD